MTTRTVTGNIRSLTDSAVQTGTVTFEKIVTSTTGTTIHQSGVTTATTDSSGDFSIALAVPASGSYRYRMILPNGASFYFSIASGASVNVATLIEAETITDQDAVVEALAAYLPLAGGTMTGALTLNGAPTVDLHAATKKYVDDNAGGGGGDVEDLTTDNGLEGNYVAVKAGGGLEYKTVEQVRTDIAVNSDNVSNRSDVTGSTVTDALNTLDTGKLDSGDIGVSVQGYSAKTAAIAALTWAANSLIWLTGTATASVQALAAHIVTFLQSATAADARTAIGAGTGNGDLLAANNLSELTATAATARGNIGAGTGNGTYTDNSTIKANDGTVSAPGLAFNGEASSGWYRSGAGVVRLALTGVNQWTFGGTNFSPASSTGPKLMNETASSTNPVFVKSDDLTSGLGWVKSGVPVIVSDSKPSCGFAYLSGVVGSAVSVIANGTGDVTLVLSGTFTVSDGAGNVAGGVITATAPGGTFNLYDDGGTNTCVLAVAADGSVTVQRTAGARTYAVNLNLNWM